MCGCSSAARMSRSRAKRSARSSRDRGRDGSLERHLALERAVGTLGQPHPAMPPAPSWRTSRYGPDAVAVAQAAAAGARPACSGCAIQSSSAAAAVGRAAACGAARGSRSRCSARQRAQPLLAPRRRRRRAPRRAGGSCARAVRCDSCHRATLSRLRASRAAASAPSPSRGCTVRSVTSERLGDLALRCSRRSSASRPSAPARAIGLRRAARAPRARAACRRRAGPRSARGRCRA